MKTSIYIPSADLTLSLYSSPQSAAGLEPRGAVQGGGAALPRGVRRALAAALPIHRGAPRSIFKQDVFEYTETQGGQSCARATATVYTAWIIMFISRYDFLGAVLFLPCLCVMCLLGLSVADPPGRR